MHVSAKYITNVFEMSHLIYSIICMLLFSVCVCVCVCVCYKLHFLLYRKAIQEKGYRKSS